MYHLETTARSLASALKIISPAIERRNTIPVLGHVLFRDDMVKGTDLDMEIEARVPANEAAGEACLPFHHLWKLVALIDQHDTVTIRVGETGPATVTFGMATYRLPTLPVGDFPLFEMRDATEIANAPENFKEALAYAHHCVSTEKTRYYLNGVCIDAKDGKSGLVATDGHRLACHKLDGDLSAFDGRIIPRATVAALLRMPSPKAMAVSGLKIMFRFDGITIKTKTIDGTFPGWRRVVPKKETATQTITVDRVKLERAVRRLNAAMEDRSGVAIAYSHGRVAVGASLGGGKDTTAVEHIPDVKLSSGTGSIGFNGQYLATALDQSRGSRRVSLRIVDGGSPMVITGDAKADAFLVVMPMRVQCDDVPLKAIEDLASAGVAAVAA